MTGIAGWVGRPGEDIPPADILDRMFGAGHAHDGADRAAETAAAGAAGVAGWPEEISTARDGDLLAAVYGIPDWHDDRLRSLAADKGAAAALLTVWRDRGTDMFTVFGGPASVAVIDLAASEAVVAIDRMGIRQMAFAPARDGGLVYASDARAVRAHPAISAPVSRQALYNFLYFYVSPGPSTIFEGIEKLQPGQYVHLRGGALSRKFYWQPSYSEPAGTDADALAADVRARLKDSVRTAVARAGESTVGAFLSGGLDSTSVSGFLTEFRPGAKCFTIAFPEEKYNELPWAEEGARRFGAEHIVHVLTPDETLAAIPGIIDAHDEPYGNSSSVPAYICAKVARENGIGTLLAGDGGDEIFAGNERYVEQRRYDPWYRLPAVLRNALVLPLLRAASSGQGAGVLARARAFADRASMPLPDRLQAYNLVATTPPQDLFAPGFIEAVDPQRTRRLPADVYDRPDGATELKRLQFLDLHITLADNDLRKVNRACELAGVRVAYPMLDETLFDLAASIPTATLLAGGRLRGFYKDMMAGYLPDSILTKQKHGFGMPFAEWTRAPGPLRDMAEAALLDFGKRNILTDGLVEEMRADLAGLRESSFGGLIWDVTMLELWLAKHELSGDVGR